jgi:hypothetical protein
MPDRIGLRARRWGLVVAAVVLSHLLAGCAAPAMDRPVDAETPGGEATLEHGYALVLGLLEDEAKVDGILAIKSPRAGIADLLRRIAEEATSDRAIIRSRLGDRPTIDPASTGLPLVEVDTRRRIEGEETPALLFSRGPAFETRMLLTQQKAAQYAAALCSSLAVADPNRERAAILREMAARWKAIERDVRAWLMAVESPPSTAGPATPVPTP